MHGQSEDKGGYITMANLQPPRNQKSDIEVDFTECFYFTDWLGLQHNNGQIVYIGNANLYQNKLPAMLSNRIWNQGEKMLITDPVLTRCKKIYNDYLSTVYIFKME